MATAWHGKGKGASRLESANPNVKFTGKRHDIDIGTWKALKALNEQMGIIFDHEDHCTMLIALMKKH